MIYMILLSLPTVVCTVLQFSLVLTQPLWTDLAHYKKRRLLQQQIPNIGAADKLWLRLEGKWPQAAVKVTLYITTGKKKQDGSQKKPSVKTSFTGARWERSDVGNFLQESHLHILWITSELAEIYQLVKHKLSCAWVLQVSIASSLLLCFERA